MATPAVTARGTPAPGIKRKDGYKTTIAFAANNTVAFWEKEVQPPGLDGGGPIDTTTMLNTLWRTMRAKALITGTPISGKAAYATKVMDQILALINVEGAITVTLPNLATLSFYGYLDKVTFDPLVEGKLPELNYTIQPTNYDPANNVEQGPVLVDITGT